MYSSVEKYLSVLFCTLLLHFVGGDYSGRGSYRGCTAVKYAYSSKGFSQIEVPSFMVSGEDLKVCPIGYSCCTATMEAKLNRKSQEEFDSTMADQINGLRATFISRSAKFDEFFTELLENAKSDLHDMFVKTYGLHYQQNAFLFIDLFQELTSYYKGSDVNLVDVLDTFFMRLLERMFILLHVSYNMDDSYMECVTGHMDELKPFGDVPQKLGQDIKRAFVAARTFVQGLQIGRDVVIRVSKLEPSKSCRQAMMKMTYCPYCSGQPHVKACHNLCLNVVKGCLSNHADLHTEWDTYIEALLKLADRLERNFNIETVVDPLDVKISDAIMNFQDNVNVITEKVYQGCGRPEYGRNKRSAESASYDEHAFNWNYGPKAPQVRPTTAAGTSLDRLIQDIKEKVTLTKGFWHSLSDSVCKDISETTDAGQCWNGMTVGRYLPDVVKDGLNNQLNNPEVDVDIRYPNSVIQQEVLQLRLITNKLRNAYMGIDVDWIDTGGDSSWHVYPEKEDTDPSGSGVEDYSGSGWDDVVVDRYVPRIPQKVDWPDSNELDPLNKGYDKSDSVNEPGQNDPGSTGDQNVAVDSAGVSVKSKVRLGLIVTATIVALWNTQQN